MQSVELEQFHFRNLEAELRHNLTCEPSFSREQKQSAAPRSWELSLAILARGQRKASGCGAGKNTVASKGDVRVLGRCAQRNSAVVGSRRHPRGQR